MRHAWVPAPPECPPSFLPLSPEPPRFVKEPRDQIGVSGGVASFVCQATGEPKPRVTWNKKGKKVNSQRFEVSTGQGVGRGWVGSSALGKKAGPPHPLQGALAGPIAPCRHAHGRRKLGCLGAVQPQVRGHPLWAPQNTSLCPSYAHRDTWMRQNTQTYTLTDTHADTQDSLPPSSSAHGIIGPFLGPHHHHHLSTSFAPQTIEFDESAGAVLRIQPLRTPRDENVYECVAQNAVGEITVHAKLTVLRGTG